MIAIDRELYELRTYHKANTAVTLIVFQIKPVRILFERPMYRDSPESVRNWLSITSECTMRRLVLHTHAHSLFHVC
jgi:hypothetical protein